MAKPNVGDLIPLVTEKEFNEHKADYVHLPYSIADGTDTYTTLINGISSLAEGMSIKIKFTNANTGASTLNINGLGEIPIKKSNGNDLSAGNIKAGQICHLVYTGSVFQLLGEGGEYGNAQAEHVLSPYTFGTEEGLKTGIMPNRGAVTRTLTTQGGTYTIPEGYHDGTGTVKAQFANLIASNIRYGVNVGGIAGLFKGDIVREHVQFIKNANGHYVAPLSVNNANLIIIEFFYSTINHVVIYIKGPIAYLTSDTGDHKSPYGRRNFPSTFLVSGDQLTTNLSYSGATSFNAYITSGRI